MMIYSSGPETIVELTKDELRDAIRASLRRRLGWQGSLSTAEISIGGAGDVRVRIPTADLRVESSDPDSPDAGPGVAWGAGRVGTVDPEPDLPWKTGRPSGRDLP